MSVVKPSVVIVDYGMGNLFSIERIVNHLGGNAIVSSEPSVVSSAERLILPGVGAFGDGMQNLRNRGLVDVIRNNAQLGRPLLGICLGMQLLMSESEEMGLNKGLDLIPGKVKRLSKELLEDDIFYKVPHVGWNKLCLPVLKETTFWEETILQGLREEAFVYFVHSYVVVPDENSVVIAETIYGNQRFCSVVRRDNLVGCQFHPEVSGEVGLGIIKNFLFSFRRSEICYSQRPLTGS